MKKIDRIVNLILEQICHTEPPKKPTYFNNLEDVYDYFCLNDKETEMDEMANIKKDFMKYEQPLRIPISEIIKSKKVTDIPKIFSKDPETGELIEDVIISDSYYVLPNGVEVLQVHVYDENGIKDKYAKYIVLPEKIYYKHPVRNVASGTEYQPKDLTQVPEDETEEDKIKRLKKMSIENDAYMKRHIIFPTINEFFGRTDILNRLDSSLIPETWADSSRTERITNVEKRMYWGGNSRSINFEFFGVRDLNSLEEALDDVLKTRMDISDGIENRERKKSQTKPREYSNYIYKKGGRWDAIQRIWDEDTFKSFGERTNILKLLKKNIQEGKKGFNVFSRLSIKGYIESNKFNIVATFGSEINFRPSGSEAEKVGNIINPIRVTNEYDLPDNIKDAQSFRDVPQYLKETLTDILKKLGNEMLQQINPDEVLNKITDLLIPSNLDSEFLDESKKTKKIKLTENQIKHIVNVIKEQSFDDALSSYQEKREKEVFMSRNDASMLLNLGSNWCEGNENHPDCKEILKIRSKLGIF